MFARLCWIVSFLLAGASVPVLAAPDIQISDARIVEGPAGTDRVLTFHVQLDAPVTVAVRVFYATGSLSAVSPADFAAAQGIATFSPGQIDSPIDIVVHGDSAVELNETFRVLLWGPSVGNIVDDTGVGTIVNDDPSPGLPALSIADATLVERDVGIGPLVFHVSLSAASKHDITVAYRTLSETALPGEDFVPRNGTLELPAGTTSVPLNVAVFGDLREENDETFEVRLSAPTNASIARGTARGTIVNNDTPAERPGLDRRPSNPTCLASGVSSHAAVRLNLYHSSVATTGYVTSLRHIPGPPERWLYAQRSGQVGLLDPSRGSSGVTLLFDARVDTELEGGLLGMALDPDFDDNGYVYLSFTESPRPREPGVFTSVVARYTLDPFSFQLHPTSRVDLLRIPQPAAHHNGGDIHFGPHDGHLYIALGDGGDWQSGDAQDPHSLLGSILRIDVRDLDLSADIPYAIPRDNPFVDGIHGAPEVFAYGLRNPWRFSFDRETGQLWAGDVGEADWEEINVIEAGRNYGWPCREDDEAFEGSDWSYCADTGFTDPVHTYANPGSAAVISGYVYRGRRIPSLYGTYLFADAYMGVLWGLRPDGHGNYEHTTLSNDAATVLFAEDSDGEIYVHSVTLDSMYRVDGSSVADGQPPPRLLSQSGCFQTTDPRQVADGVLPYRINEPFWSDNANKDRYLAIPDGQRIGINDQNDLEFPVGSVLIKHFRLEDRLFETRLLMHQAPDVWEGFSYRWNEQGIDAVLLDDAREEWIEGQWWHFPSSTECQICHTRAAGFALGPELAQLNRSQHYPTTGRTASQLDTWAAVGLFDTTLSSQQLTDTLPPSRDNPTVPIETRVRSYLHSNCASCHRGPGGPALGTDIDFLHTTSWANMNVCERRPQRGDMGVASARLVDPGHPDTSIVYLRLLDHGLWRMPPLGSNELDEEGAALVAEWIESLSGCP